MNILSKIADVTGLDSLANKLGFGGGNLKMTDVDKAMDKKNLMKKGGKVSSASKRADGIATKGKTRGRMV